MIIGYIMFLVLLPLTCYIGYVIGRESQRETIKSDFKQVTNPLDPYEKP